MPLRDLLLEDDSDHQVMCKWRVDTLRSVAGELRFFKQCELKKLRNDIEISRDILSRILDALDGK